MVDNPLPQNEGEECELSQASKLMSPLSKEMLPYEDNYNQALATTLRKLGYTVSTLWDARLGKTDVVVTYEKCRTCAFECIIATRPPVSLLRRSRFDFAPIAHRLFALKG